MHRCGLSVVGNGHTSSQHPFTLPGAPTVKETAIAVVEFDVCTHSRRCQMSYREYC
eukprot:m.331705 g.331705  ORF g.331705 m.331705 type:complete len:56 (+) comp16055_c1_seq2:1093-1260(+)